MNIALGRVMAWCPRCSDLILDTAPPIAPTPEPPAAASRPPASLSRVCFYSRMSTFSFDVDRRPSCAAAVLHARQPWLPPVLPLLLV